jgi:hypothetical protein
MSVEATKKKDAVSRINKAITLLPILNQAENLLDSIPSKTGFGGKLAGLGSYAQGALNIDPIAATVMSQSEAFKPLIARGLSEVGNLAQAEQASAKNLPAMITDAKDTRIMKALGARVFIRNKVIKDVELSGLKDPKYTLLIQRLDKEIAEKRKLAIDAGISEERLNKFLKTYDNLGVNEEDEASASIRKSFETQGMKVMSIKKVNQK